MHACICLTSAFVHVLACLPGCMCLPACLAGCMCSPACLAACACLHAWLAACARLPACLAACARLAGWLAACARLAGWLAGWLAGCLHTPACLPACARLHVLTCMCSPACTHLHVLTCMCSPACTHLHGGAELSTLELTKLGELNLRRAARLIAHGASEAVACVCMYVCACMHAVCMHAHMGLINHGAREAVCKDGTPNQMVGPGLVSMRVAYMGPQGW